MAELFLFDISGHILMKISSLAYQEVCLLWGLERDLRKLEETLSTIKAVLLDAEEQQAHNHQLCVWLGRLKDVFYDAEDVLDEFECETLRRNVVKRGSARRKVSRFFSNSNPLAFRVKMGRKIKLVREKLDRIASEKSKFHLVERVELRRVFSRQMTHSFVCSSDVVGRDNDVENIINFLMQPSEVGNISVIPIVGIGGLGKTCLAKMIYNDEMVGLNFKLKMWVCVSADFDVARLMKEMISSATKRTCSELTIDQLQACLREVLDDRKYFLVLDDVWSESRVRWIELRELLMGGAAGSKIVVTTRSHQVASIMGTVPTYILKGLPHEDCMSLFVKWAFRDGEERMYPNLIKVGHEIVKKCVGVPLAVRTVGSLLFTKNAERDWLLIRDNELWSLEQREDDILPALKLSYDHLPTHLERCFAYCSLFPKDYVFDCEYLVYYWMALGLLGAPKDNEELEDVGLRYLNELVSRCFFQDVVDCGSYFMFKMHDLIHDLALSVGQRECSRVHFGTQNVDRKIRHFSFNDTNFYDKTVPNFLTNSKSVRTIFFPRKEYEPVAESFVYKCMSKFKYIRLLYLRCLLFEVLPDSIGTLKLLRCLDLSQNKLLERLPESICKLQSLQTLKLLACSGLNRLPNNIANMISLRYLEVTTKAMCLPENGIGSMNSLRYLAFCNCNALVNLFGMQGLTGLRVLYVRNCRSLISLPGSIKYLSRLQKLVIMGCDKLNLRMDLQAWEGLQLNLRIFMLSDLPELVDLPEIILQGSANTLQYMKIEACPNLRTLPTWLANLTSLQKLEIIKCPRLSSLPEEMHRLTALTELKIQNSPALSDSCRQDWPKISHIPNVYLD